MCVLCVPHVALVIFVLDPALVFGEILGVIKGSEKTIGTQDRCLGRDTYLSGRHQRVLSHAKGAIYDLFTTYTRLKQQCQEYDAADRLVAPGCSHNGTSFNLTAGHTIY